MPEKRPSVAQDSLLRSVSQTDALGMLAFASGETSGKPVSHLSIDARGVLIFAPGELPPGAVSLSGCVS
jgi:hypothetical protein